MWSVISCQIATDVRCEKNNVKPKNYSLNVISLQNYMYALFKIHEVHLNKRCTYHRLIQKIDLVDFKFLQINFLKINISNSEQWMYFSSLTPAWAEPSSKNNTISYIFGIQIIINYNYVLLTRKIIHIYGANWHILHYTLEYLNWRFVYVTNRLNSCGQNQANQLSLQRHSHHLK